MNHWVEILEMIVNTAVLSDAVHMETFQCAQSTETVL